MIASAAHNSILTPVRFGCGIPQPGDCELIYLVIIECRLSFQLSLEQTQLARRV